MALTVPQCSQVQSVNPRSQDVQKSPAVPAPSKPGLNTNPLQLVQPRSGQTPLQRTQTWAPIGAPLGISLGAVPVAASTRSR